MIPLPSSQARDVLFSQPARLRVLLARMRESKNTISVTEKRRC